MFECFMLPLKFRKMRSDCHFTASVHPTPTPSARSIEISRTVAQSLTALYPTTRRSCHDEMNLHVEVFILDKVFASLPTPPFSADEKRLVAGNVYAHVWQQAMSGELGTAA
jgi:hypothetical protein